MALKKKNVIIFPSFSGNKLNIYCIYIKNYTQSSREMLMSLLLRRTERWGLPGSISLSCYTPARGCLENACTAKLIQKRIHNLGGLSNFEAPQFFFVFFLLPSYLLFLRFIALSCKVLYHSAPPWNRVILTTAAKKTKQKKAFIPLGFGWLHKHSH